MAGDRRAVQANISVESSKGWDRFLTEHGRTFTSIIEAIGLDLAEGRSPVPARVLREAAKVDRTRGSRRPRV